MHTLQEASKILHSLNARQQNKLLRGIPFAWTCFQVGIFASVFLPLFAGGIAKQLGTKVGYSTVWALIPVAIVMLTTYGITMFGVRWLLIRHISTFGLPMEPVEFPCVGCARVLRFAGSAVGKQGKCPQCGAIQIISNPAPVLDR